jgi:hypothetical protein
VRRVAAILSALFLGAVAVMTGICVHGMATRLDPTSTSPEEAYRALIANPIPATVTHLQGGGTTWQGYSISLRFRAPSLESAGFTQPPYRQVDCARLDPNVITNTFAPSPFTPEWNIPETGSPRCLKWSELSNDWTTLGNHSVLYVEGWVFFVGRGG